MAYLTLLIEDVKAVRWITVNRPEKLNALNRQVLDDLGQRSAARATVRSPGSWSPGPARRPSPPDIAEFSD
jgi:hypothetical protein